MLQQLSSCRIVPIATCCAIVALVAWELFYSHGAFVRERDAAIIPSLLRRPIPSLSAQFKELEDCKIFVLDMMRFPHSSDRTPCKRDAHYFKTWMRVMDIDHIKGTPDTVLAIQLQQHGWPAVLSNAILSTTLAAVTLEDADVALVDMSCYAEEDILRLHGDRNYVGLRDAHDVLSKLKQTPAWAVKGGAGFVLMAPHPNTFDAYHASRPCYLPNSYFIAADPTRMCSVAQAAENLTIAPSNCIADIPSKATIMEADRTRLVWFRGACSNVTSGRGMRKFFVDALRKEAASTDESDVLVTCALGNHSATMQEILTTNFCLTFSGDGMPSRRISEVIAAGCIPVLIGPPWHIRPLPDYIRWEEFSLFFEMRNAARWTPGGDPEKDHLITSPWAQKIPPNARYYIVDEPRQVIDALRSVPQSEIGKLKNKLMDYRSYMMFGGLEPGETSLATLAMMNNMCAYGKRLRMRETWQAEKARLGGGYLLDPESS